MAKNPKVSNASGVYVLGSSNYSQILRGVNASGVSAGALAFFSDGQAETPKEKELNLKDWLDTLK